MKEIRVYSTSTCPYCKMAKQYLSSKGESYQEFDVSRNEEALQEMVKVSGQTGVPVIVIDNDVIVGFDRARIDSLLT